MHRISVLLPEPDGPHKTIFSPARTDRLMSVRALKSPYHFSTCSIRIIGAPLPVAREGFMTSGSPGVATLLRREGHALHAVREFDHRRAHPLLLNLGQLSVSLDLVDEAVQCGVHFLVAKAGARAVEQLREFQLVL